ncbi:hypothetical protein HDZ31DRAFT_41429 [Schizophyllum fasciatum]
MIQVGPVQLEDDSEKVVDADEEIFLLYTALQAHPLSGDAHHGLGFLDSHHDTISVAIELDDPRPGDNGPRPIGASVSTHGKHPSHRNSRHAPHARKAPKSTAPETVQVELYQDKTRLHTAKGDTGSVLWRASIDFAKMMLRQHHSPNSASIFDKRLLPDLRVLELGAGTGLLSVLLAPLVKHYMATDIPGLTHLISKNVAHNLTDNDTRNNVAVEALDWEQLHQTSPERRRRFFTYAGGPGASEARPYSGKDATNDAPDVILAVDCLYHPSLVGPLVSTLNHFARPNETVVVIVSELRAEDVMRDFLEAWLGDAARWEIWRAGDGADGPGLLGVPYVIWVGRKVSASAPERDGSGQA